MLNLDRAKSNVARRSQPAGFSLVELLVVIIILFALAALILPARRSAGDAAKRAVCQNNLKQIATALQNYSSRYGRLPPAYTVSPDGQRLHSWRTLILPFLDLQGLYSRVDLSKPWNDPANAVVADFDLKVYRCPESESSIERTDTHYLAVLSADGCFPGAESRNLDELPGDSRRTMMLVDAGSGHAVHWMSPEDIAPSQLADIAAVAADKHLGVLVVAFADGSARQILPTAISRESAIADDDQ